MTERNCLAKGESDDSDPVILQNLFFASRVPNCIGGKCATEDKISQKSLVKMLSSGGFSYSQDKTKAKIASISDPIYRLFHIVVFGFTGSRRLDQILQDVLVDAEMLKRGVVPVEPQVSACHLAHSPMALCESDDEMGIIGSL